MADYDEITAAFQYARPDAELLLHESVEDILQSFWSDKLKLDKIRCAYAAAKAGQAVRSSVLRSAGESPT